MNKQGDIRCIYRDFSERISGNNALRGYKYNSASVYQIPKAEKYDFDTVVDRYGTNSLKYDFAEERGYPKDILPLWVADMDFVTAEPIVDSLRKTAEHGIFGYSNPKDDYYEAAASWFEKYFAWRPEKEWLVKTPGIVFALSMAVRAYTNVGDGVIIQTPVYYPFYSVIENNDRKVVKNELKFENRHYEIDFEDFENKIKENQVKLFIFCSPHNPTGRVWTEKELKRIADICLKYDVIVISDEIHCDFSYPGHQHHILTKACPELENQAVICTSPSKTFNIAGLQISNIWIKNRKLRHQMNREIVSCGYTEFNIFGIKAAKAAYEEGEEWHQKSWEYIRRNLDFVRNFLNKYLPEIKLIEPEGTYFAWLDCTKLGLSKEELNDLIINKAGLWLDAGHIFGQGAEMFQRIVLACPRQTLQKALIQLEHAVKNN